MPAIEGLYQLCCSRVTGEGGDPTKICTSPFQPEDGKKSSFLLSESSTIPHPASVDVRYVVPSSPTENAQIFFLGGFQLVANAKSVEIYLTDKDGKESYLTTSKGIVQPKGENGEEWQKAVCVIPGGPRPILKLKIKLLSLKPTGSSQAKVLSLKLTARLPEKATTAKSSNAPRSNAPSLFTPTQGLPQTGGSLNAITTDDLGAVMASISILARSTESSIESSLTEKFNHLDRSIQTRFSVLEHHIGELVSVVSAQRTGLEQQAKLLKAQQEQIRNQAQQMEQLIGQNRLDSQTLHDIRTYFSSLRNSNGGPTSISRGFNLKIPTTTAEEEPSERGIEQTLSNLELNDRREHGFGSHYPTGEGTEATEEILETGIKLVARAADSSMNQAVEVPEDIERIEVSLSESNQETLAGCIHEEEGARDFLPPLQSSQHPGLSLGKNGSMARPSRSFEDRNDKNEKKEVPANSSDTVQLEVLAVGEDEDETFEVMESTTADEHERSPPELNVESKRFE